MRIVQISDLHFGAHLESLADALKRRMKEIRPDVIVVTGDLVDEPNVNLFSKAKQYLLELEECCADRPRDDPERPRILCIPGNHDILPGGYRPRKWRLITWPLAAYGAFKRGQPLPKMGPWRLAKYALFFESFSRNHFFQPENVWIFGFDSARSEILGGGGAITVEDLDCFHTEYDSLKAKFGPAFERAFKVVVVHHHPLPVNWETDWKQRWLTMINSGTFLASILHRRVDLILHGHEHLQAHAQLRSSLGGRSESETTVVSVGTTLARENHGRNWFNVIAIETDGAVTITSYPGFNRDFEQSGESKSIRSIQQARDASFDGWKRESGFYYREVTSATILDKDGDAKRSVECNGLLMINPGTDRAVKHVVELSYTSGYIDLPETAAAKDCDLSGMYFEEPPPDRTTPLRSLKRTILWNRKLLKDEQVSYSYSWFAVNGFAMDERQFACKYAVGAPVEFTHFVVEDPIDELTVVVQFPEKFSLPATPEIRVGKYEGSQDARRWSRNHEVERELRESGALRHVQAIRTAALRVRRPLKGFSYGIQWRVPTSIPRREGLEAARIRDILDMLLRTKSPEPSLQEFFVELLGRISLIARQGLELNDWPNTLESSFMVFDAEARQLRMIGSAFTQMDNGKIRVWYPEEPNFRNTTFEYGDGIAGRAFKTNDCRFYVRPSERGKEPNYYRQLAGQQPHCVVLSLPIRNPVDDAYAYGVLNLSSADACCPLRSVGFSDWQPQVGHQPKPSIGDTLASLQKGIGKILYDALSRKLLDEAHR